AAPAVRDLVAALSDKSAEVQFEAVIALEHIGPAARSAVPDLIAILRGPEVRLHSGAMDALGSIGRDSLPAVPVLLERMNGDDPHLATSAGMALARILSPDSEEMKQVIPALVKSIKNTNPQIR